MRSNMVMPGEVEISVYSEGEEGPAGRRGIQPISMQRASLIYKIPLRKLWREIH
jgi:hypothetical protein